MNSHTYVGGELDLFAQAQRWKGYWISRVRRYITGAVLEVGAGIGANTVLLRTGAEARWLCLEPDPRLAARLENTMAAAPGDGRAPSRLEARVGTVASLDLGDVFDTILYIDVLEHIENDRLELAAAARHLAPGGHMVVLSPAHSWLFSPFDQAIGHFRRYTAKELRLLTPSGLRVAKSFYLDSVGLLASVANRFMLHQNLPSARQIHCWDSLMVPCSRVLDPVTAYRFGKSVVCIWTRPGPPAARTEVNSRVVGDSGAGFQPAKHGHPARVPNTGWKPDVAGKMPAPLPLADFSNMSAEQGSAEA